MRPYRAFPAWRSPGRLPKWKPAVGPFQRRLRIEPLEDRLLLATVTTLVDGIGVPGTSLREAIADATPGETISFSVAGTIDLSSLGQLVINKNLTINGPGVNLLTINAFDPTPTSNNGDGSRVFLIDDGTAAIRTVSISGLALTGGDTTGGGAIFNSENLTLTTSRISGNAAMFGGGGIYSGSGTSLTIASSTITGNVASLGSGMSTSGATVTITSSTVSGNVAASYGGGIFAQASSVTLSASTVSDNSANYGGGVFSRLGSLTLTSSTVSANQVAISGGGIFSSSADLSVKHSTITGNRSNSDSNLSGIGGGMAIYGSGAHELGHAIVAGNARTGQVLRDDIFGTVAARFSLVGDNTGATITNNGGNLIGTGAAPIDPVLGSLLDNGGPTLTHALLFGSPAIDAGNAAFSPPPNHDQRGAPFTRMFDGDGTGGARIDMGAYERQTVANPNFVVDTLVDENDGNYAAGDLSLREVIGVANGSVGADTISFATSLTSGGPVTILLTLGELAISDPLTINGPGANLLIIDASGSDPTPSINEGNGSRVLFIADGNEAAAMNVELIGLTLTGGDTLTRGGAIYSIENLTIRACTISGNSSFDEGGGIASSSRSPNFFIRDLNVIESIITGNSTSRSGGGIYARETRVTVDATTVSDNSAGRGGGGIHSIGDLNVTDSTISGNGGVSGEGGGILCTAGDLNVTRSTISHNFSDDGGGIAFYTNFGSATLVETTISFNEGIYGGGIAAATQGAVKVSACTITRNEARLGGGIYHKFGTMIVENTTIAWNEAGLDGGGIYVLSGDLTLAYCTIYFNVGHNGVDGIFIEEIAFPPADVRLDHTIVADISGEVSARYSLITSINGATIIDNGGNLIGIDPLLSFSLIDNGGPTLTYALLPGSPAIDAGDPSAVPGVSDVPLNDQRGAPFARFADGDATGGARVDIGAYERQTLAASNFIVDTLSDENNGDYAAGDRSLREVIGLAFGSAGAETITFAASLTSGGPATIMLTHGALAIRDAMTVQGPGASLLTIDASGSDPTPTMHNGDGSGVFSIASEIATVLDVELSGLTLTGGDTSNLGGAIFNLGNLAVSSSIVSGNAAMLGGGGIYSGMFAQASSVTLTSTTVSNNMAASYGGGIFAQSSNVTVSSSTVNHNSGSYGGGIFSRLGSLTLTGSTVSANQATISGGGIFSSSADLSMKHSTITGNQANIDNNATGLGGGMAIYGSGIHELDHAIVAANTRGAGLRDEILGAAAARFSLIGDNTGATITNNGGNLIGTSAAPINPLLGPLADNGGPTMTHALLPSSPAIDSGDPSAAPGVGGVPLFDQRGAPYTRVFNGDAVPGARIDIGAFELQPIGPALPGDYNHNNVVDAADYTLWRNTLGAVVASFSGADGDGSGTIDAADYDVWRSHFGQTLPGAGGGGNSSGALAESIAPVLASESPVTQMQGGDPIYDGNLFHIAPVVPSLRSARAPQGMPGFAPAIDRDNLLLAVISVATFRPIGEATDEVAAHDADRDRPDELLAAVDRVFELL